MGVFALLRLWFGLHDRVGRFAYGATGVGLMTTRRSWRRASNHRISVLGSDLKPPFPCWGRGPPGNSSDRGFRLIAGNRTFDDSPSTESNVQCIRQTGSRLRGPGHLILQDDLAYLTFVGIH